MIRYLSIVFFRQWLTIPLSITSNIQLADQPNPIKHPLIEKCWIVVIKSGQLHPFALKFVYVNRNHQKKEITNIEIFKTASPPESIKTWFSTQFKHF